MGIRAAVARLRTIRETIGRSFSPIGWAPYMASTILSENQNEAKFMTSAMTKAITMTERPPRNAPMATNRAVSSASRTVVFTALAMTGLLGDKSCSPNALGVLTGEPNKRPGERQGTALSDDESFTGAFPLTPPVTA